MSWLNNATAKKLSPKPDVLIFLENTAQMTQKAQQLKLASLGRLTASLLNKHTHWVCFIH